MLAAPAAAGNSITSAPMSWSQGKERLPPPALAFQASTPMVHSYDSAGSQMAQWRVCSLQSAVAKRRERVEATAHSAVQGAGRRQGQNLGSNSTVCFVLGRSTRA